MVLAANCAVSSLTFASSPADDLALTVKSYTWTLSCLFSSSSRLFSVERPSLADWMVSLSWSLRYSRAFSSTKCCSFSCVSVSRRDSSSFLVV